jgi:translation initiation factor 2-alpha kinase 4
MRLIHLRLAKDGHDSALIYTKARDIHYAGVVFLQMLLGRDVVERFPDAQAALISCESCRGAIYVAYNPLHSPGTPSPSANCVEHGLSKEEIHIMFCHSRRTGSNLVHKIAPNHDTNFR